MKVSISKAAKEMGVAIETLRRWEAAGKIEDERTPRGHRRYNLATQLCQRYPSPRRYCDSPNNVLCPSFQS